MMMQDLVGIVRREGRVKGALEGLAKLRERSKRVKVPGNREFNPGWHTALDLPNLFTRVGRPSRAALSSARRAGARTREDFPDKDPAWGKMNLVVRKARTARCSSTAFRSRRCRLSSSGSSRR